MAITLPFIKMQGCGNDYIFLDAFAGAVALTPLQIQHLADRRVGIGADGVVVLSPSPAGDALMRMYNPDGTESPMCGNAIRCAAKFLYESGYVPRESMTIETLSGVKEIRVTTEGGRVPLVLVNMGPAVVTPGEVSVAGYGLTRVSVGNPHAVAFCEDPEAIPLPETGPLVEHDPLFPEGVNAEFVRVIKRNHLQMRVWERGAGETFACGTGACAAAAAAVAKGLCDADTDITVAMRGGALVICVGKEAVTMTGPCEEVFRGVIPL